MPPLNRGPAPRQSAQNEEQYDGADERDDDRVQINAADGRVAEQIKDPTAEERTDDADDDVADDAARSLAGYDHFRERSRD